MPPALPPVQIVGILLAAGSSTRFGGFKLMHPIEGVPMALKSAMAMKSALGAVLVAVRPGSPCIPTLLGHQGIEIVECARAPEGMGGTLADAVAAISGPARGFVVALADMPFIHPDSIVAVARTLTAGAALAAPVFRGARGHPVGLASTYRSELLSLGGDAGARSIIARDAARIVTIDVDDPGVVRDIDTPDDLPAASAV